MLERAEVRRIQKSWSRAQLFYNTMKYHLVLCGKRGHDVCVPNQQQHMCGRAFLSYGHGFTSDSLRTHRYRYRYRSPHTTIIHNHAFTAFLNMSVSAHFQNSLGPVKTCGPTYLMCRRSAQFRVCESGGSRRSSRI